MLKASIALTTVMVITGMLLFSGVAVIVTGIDLTFITRDYNHRLLADIQVNSCLEETMFILKKEKDFVGQQSFATANGTCNTVVTNESATIKNIIIISEVQDIVVEDSFRVDISENPNRIIN